MEFLGINPVREREVSASSGGEVLLWHDAVHERLESMQLYFWRLAFSPRYPRKRVFDSLQHFYEEARISSYVVYETLGDFDLLLRVWAPRAYNAEELELLLRQSLEGCYLWNLNYLACKTELHFSTNGQECEPPSVSRLESVRVPLIDEINRYNDRQWQYLLDPEVEGVEDLERPPEAESLIEEGILRPVPLDTRGIRMFITFDHPRQPFRPETRKYVVRDIRRKCDEVRESWQGRTERVGTDEEVEVLPPKISIYAGAGSMTDFLVMVRAPHKHFHAFVGDLIYGIRDIGLDEKYEMRPYTHVIADQMFSEFKEHRVVAAEAGDILKLIQKDEDEVLEMKATLNTNFRSLVAVGRHDPDPKMVDEIVKTLCGFLNSPKGGTLIIGVLEVRRELEKVRDRERYLGTLKERFGYSPADEEGEISFPNAVIGIEVDFEGGSFSDADEYVRHLQDTLKSRITPNPWPWLRIELEEVEDKKLCVIWVRPGDVWFYAQAGDPPREEFFVREGASTPALSWAESDLYKRVYPREVSQPGEPKTHD